LLRQYAVDHQDACYISADTVPSDEDLWKTIGLLRDHYGFRVFLLDEIHFLADATSLLKRLYDFLDVQVIFSSSVALAMRASAFDLSRRVNLEELYPFSFREYLAFSQDIHLPQLSLGDLLSRNWSPEHLRVSHLFSAYLEGGLLPFSLEEAEPLPFLANIIEKVIARDIPSIASLRTEELEHIRRLLKFVGRSGVDGLNYTSIASNLGITKYKAEQYLDCLEKAFILHRIFPAGTNVLREPKILLAPPCRLLFRDKEDAIGGLREDYFVETMRQARIPIEYLKSTRGAKTPDFLVECGSEKIAIEVGGKGKGREQFKGIKVDAKIVVADTAIPENGRIPLFLFGFL
jgi:predicted AAA+ superfamily ATPase